MHIDSFGRRLADTLTQAVPLSSHHIHRRKVDFVPMNFNDTLGPPLDSEEEINFGSYSSYPGLSPYSPN